VLLPLLLTLAACTRLSADHPLYRNDRPEPAKEVSGCPADTWRNVDPDTPIRVRFDGPLDDRTITWETVLLGSDREHIRGAVRYDPTSYTIFYRPYEALLPLHRYDLYLLTGILDLAGRPVYASQEVKTFWTGERGDPELILCPDDPFQDPVLPGDGDEVEDETGEDETDAEGEVTESAEGGESEENSESADSLDSEGETATEEEGSGTEE